MHTPATHPFLPHHLFSSNCFGFGPYHARSSPAGVIRPRCQGWAGRPRSERHVSSPITAAGAARASCASSPQQQRASGRRRPLAPVSAGQANAHAGAQRTPVQPAAAARTPPSAAVDSPDEPRASPAPAPAPRQRGPAPELSRQQQQYQRKQFGAHYATLEEAPRWIEAQLPRGRQIGCGGLLRRGARVGWQRRGRGVRHRVRARTGGPRMLAGDRTRRGERWDRDHQDALDVGQHSSLWSSVSDLCKLSSQVSVRAESTAPGG